MKTDAQRAREWRQRNAESVREKDRIRSRARRRRDPETFRAYQRKKDYGIDAAEYAALFARHNGLCAICGGSANLHIDHDHTTGLVRGLLCARCNSGLGHIERAGFVDAAYSYLRRRAAKVAS